MENYPTTFKILIGLKFGLKQSRFGGIDLLPDGAVVHLERSSGSVPLNSGRTDIGHRYITSIYKSYSSRELLDWGLFSGLYLPPHSRFVANRGG